MLTNLTFIVRFFIDGDFSDEVEYVHEHDAREHFGMFDATDGYSSIELIKRDWVKRQDTLIDAVTF